MQVHGSWQEGSSWSDPSDNAAVSALLSVQGVVEMMVLVVHDGEQLFHSAVHHHLQSLRLFNTPEMLPHQQIAEEKIKLATTNQLHTLLKNLNFLSK